MRIAIGAIVRTLGGPATYATELVAALAGRRTAGIEYVVLTDGPEAFAGAGVETIELPLASPYDQLRWDHVRVPRALRAAGADLYHGTKNALPLARPCPTVVTIHDLAVYHHPASFAAAQRWHVRLHTAHAVRAARAVIAVSEHAAADVRARFPGAAGKVHAVPNGVGARFASPPSADAVREFRARHGLRGSPTVGYLGTVQPRKHVDALVGAFARVVAAMPDAELLIAGRVRPGHRPAVAAERVRMLGPLGDADVPLFYGAVDVLVNPSTYEGFGLTVAEAMACGCPVIAVRASAVPEVVGDAAVLVDAPTADALAAALLRVLTDTDLAAELRTRGPARARRFSWDAAAAATEAVYLEAARRPPSSVTPAATGVRAAGGTDRSGDGSRDRTCA